MAASDMVLQVLSGAGSSFCNFTPCLFKPRATIRSHIRSTLRNDTITIQSRSYMRTLRACVGIDSLQGVAVFSQRTAINSLRSVSCNCRLVEKQSEFVEDGKRPDVVENPDKPTSDLMKGTIVAPDRQEFGKHIEEGSKSLNPNGKEAANGTISNALGRAGVSSFEDEAWDLLRESIVYYFGNPVGTIAANDHSDLSMLNYDQVFIRDFIPSGMAFLLKGEYDIVRNFILCTLQLQSWEKTMDCHSPGQGLMPASFKVRTVPLDGDDLATEDVLDPDFGEAAIGRVAPVDSGLWWIILLRAYGKFSGDLSIQERIDVQTGIKMILKLCLSDGFDMFPTLLVTDGSCMIDRRMGIHGHPLEIQASLEAAAMDLQAIFGGLEEVILLWVSKQQPRVSKQQQWVSKEHFKVMIGAAAGHDQMRAQLAIIALDQNNLQSRLKQRQFSDNSHPYLSLLVDVNPCVMEEALFHSAMLCAREMLAPEDGSADLIRALNNRLVALSFHIREYYWLDLKKLNVIYRYKTEEYSYDAVNKFNIYPDQIPSWLGEWMPNKGGYLIGNLQPAHMDFRFFSLGNLWSIICSLASVDQSHAILDLIESKWGDLVAEMPLKICYPALEGQEWRIITGSDPKNTPWSYHNAGSWPTLLWQLTVASIKMNRPEIAEKAVKVAEKRIAGDKWPEYYDTKRSRFIGKQARLFQTWSIAGYLVAKLLLVNPNAAKNLINEEDSAIATAFSSIISGSPRRKRGRKQSYII